MWRWRIKLARGEWTLPSLNLKILVCKHRSVIFAVRASQHVMELCLRLSQEVQPMHASQHCITPRDRLVVSVSQLRIDTFLDRCRVAVGLTVPCVLCRRHKLGVITQSHSQTVQHTLDTADVIVGFRVLAAAQLGDLLHKLAMARISDGVFVCNLLIKSVIEPFSSSAELGNWGMRDANWESAVELHDELR